MTTDKTLEELKEIKSRIIDLKLKIDREAEEKIKELNNLFEMTEQVYIRLEIEKNMAEDKNP